MFKPIFLIRLSVGAIFLSEGIQKFLFPLQRGSGRFETIGLPYPELLGPFVGTCEIIAGMLILIGWYVKPAALVTFIIMLVAIGSTKVLVLEDKGFWEMLHGGRTDWAMLLSSLFLMLELKGSFFKKN